MKLYVRTNFLLQKYHKFVRLKNENSIKNEIH